MTLLLTMLQHKLDNSRTSNGHRLLILSCKYDNIAPLYVNEPLRLCGREIQQRIYELWIEAPGGWVAVRAVVEVEPRVVTKFPFVVGGGKLVF